jgi:ElaB/YqjD/DUF883 family membrane-anchored ribosome-binding protein
MSKLTPRQQAEAIEQFGDDLAKLCRDFDRLCQPMASEAIDHINAVQNQDHLDSVAEAFRALGDRLCREIDLADEAEDRARDNPLHPHFRRLGQ